MDKVKVGLLGTGDISGIYCENLTNLFEEVEIAAVCDLVKEKALKKQEMYNIPIVYDTMEEMFADPDIEIIVNLTRPYEHFETSKAALLAGKHVYSEKPLAASFEEGQVLYELAEKKGLMLGGAPDTFLGAGIQTCRKLIEDGWIGDVVGGTARMTCRGHEGWHPDPAFYYQYGGGPMLDMGPYYVTALVNLMGRVAGVSAMTDKTFEKRIIGSSPKKGQVIDVSVSTNLAGIMRFDSGAIAQILMSFDIYYDRQDCLEIYGTKGTLKVPDPNTFGGQVYLLRPEEGAFKEIPLLFDYKENSRGLGVADMAKALQTGRPFRAGVHQTYHVLEILTAFDKSSENNQYIPMTSPYTPAPPMINEALRGVLS